MNELEKKFFKIITGFDYPEIDGLIYPEQEQGARAAAKLCIEEMREAYNQATMDFSAMEVTKDHINKLREQYLKSKGYVIE